ncbi:YARHG domain-containing protein [Ekhidna lutea]|uniref:YARHG domain-containing protein n=1 Tax=Ekhidna lutea TaxID=447679 RepID=A0A239MCV8_EKHLU|nr:YARHG domain-containing protein [Ekhidna lutea]SNT40320.1 YARHG domain-containing protein [Ekhidna lutea]
MRIVVLTIFLIPLFANAQVIVDYNVDETLVGTWKPAELDNYEGVYRFGWSEWESEFYLAIDGDLICAQVKDHEWINSDNEELRGWQSRYKNLHNVRIVGNKFYSDETNGEFVTYELKGEKINGLKLENPPNSHDEKYEIGIFQTEDKLTFFSGKYRTTKFDVLTTSELMNYNLADLKILRNEIFARYGYVFKKGGEMEKHFKRQKWYHPIERDVNPLLTEIERQNIANIRAMESKKSP